MKEKRVDRPCIRIQRGGIISISCRICTSREREGREGWGWRAEGERIVLFAICPFLLHTVPKKNKRTNTFLNKGRALDVETHWGLEVAPLWLLRCSYTPISYLAPLSLCVSRPETEQALCFDMWRPDWIRRMWWAAQLFRSQTKIETVRWLNQWPAQINTDWRSCGLLSNLKVKAKFLWKNFASTSLESYGVLLFFFFYKDVHTNPNSSSTLI